MVNLWENEGFRTMGNSWFPTEGDGVVNFVGQMTNGHD